MTTQDLVRRYWRVPVVALLAAVLAFAGSYIVSDRYESSTRLLVHGRDATFLTSTGEDLSTQPGVVDASLSQALLSTYAGIATSRVIAVSVVDELELDQVRPPAGVYASVKQGLKWVYRCTRAVVTSGFCAKADPREAAILAIQQHTTAEPTGTNEGSNAGTQSSYVLEVRSSGASPEQAEAVTDALANQLVELSNDRFARDADANVAGLETQVGQAQEELSSRTQAVAAYQTKHSISAGDAKLALSAATSEDVRADLLKARADLADTRAQLASVDGSLSRIPRDQRVKQTIVTGRSTTKSETDQVNSVYSDLLTRLNTLKAEEAGLLARVARLREQVGNTKPLARNRTLAQLTVLQQRADLAADNVRNLNATLQKARITAAQGSVDLSRIDEASRPTYPAEPKRYIYLALGLLLGALTGAFLTARAQRSGEAEEPVAAAGEDQADPRASSATNGRVSPDEMDGRGILYADSAVGSRQPDAAGGGSDGTPSGDGSERSA